MLKSITERVRRLANIRSARGVSFAVSAIALASKPLGYARMLMIAWLFGTSAGMDSYHLAHGIVMLFAGCLGSAVQSAALPELQRVKTRDGETSCRALTAFLSWIDIFVISLFVAAFVIAPGVLIRLFAGGFDDERILMGSRMILWLIPFAICMMIRPIIDVWAMLTEKFLISSITSIIFNFVAIPTLLISSYFIGDRSVAAAESVGYVAMTLLFLIGVGGIPITLRTSLVPWRSVGTIFKNAFFSFVTSCMGMFYMVIDRYFASLLPRGAVASISYGATIIAVITALSSSPMLFLLNRLSAEVSRDDALARSTLSESMAMVGAYFIPFSAMFGACAHSLVSIIYGWGNFGAESVAMTSTVIAAYAVGLPFSTIGSLVSSYATARQKLKIGMLLSPVGIIVNTSLNMALIDSLGLLGLALATSMTQIIMLVVNYVVFVRSSFTAFALRSKMPHQIALSLAMAAISIGVSRFGSAAQLAVSAVLMVIYFASVERLGVLSAVPPHWRPLPLLRFIKNAASSYIGGRS